MVASYLVSHRRMHDHGNSARTQLSRGICVSHRIPCLRPHCCRNVRLLVVHLRSWNCGNLLLRHPVVLCGQNGGGDAAMCLRREVDRASKPLACLGRYHNDRTSCILHVLVRPVGIHVYSSVEVALVVHYQKCSCAASSSRHICIHRWQNRRIRGLKTSWYGRNFVFCYRMGIHERYNRQSQNPAKRVLICLGINTVSGTLMTEVSSNPDLARYARRPRNTTWPQWFGLVIAKSLCTFLGIGASSAVKTLWGTAYWNIWDLVSLLEVC